MLVWSKLFLRIRSRVVKVLSTQLHKPKASEVRVFGGLVLEKRLMLYAGRFCDCLQEWLYSGLSCIAISHHTCRTVLRIAESHLIELFCNLCKNVWLNVGLYSLYNIQP